MKKLINLFGQIRIYSLIDLILLCVALKANSSQLIGVVFLHLGFLLFLEFTHKHEFRSQFPKYLWLVLLIIGMIFYHNIAMLGFLICSFLYVKKNVPKLGVYSPFFRGLQYYFLCAGIIGFLNPLAFFVGLVLAIRNFNGDLRDIVKDTKEGLKTLPIVLGLKKDMKSIHLISMLSTSFI